MASESRASKPFPELHTSGASNRRTHHGTPSISKPFVCYSHSTKASANSLLDQEITIYPSKIQRNGYIQPFGFVIIVDEPSFRVIGYSENARDFLSLDTPQSVPSLEECEALEIGSDLRNFFTPFSVLQLGKAFEAVELSQLNPIWVRSGNSEKPFYAILHRIDVGVVIDFEPARTEDPELSISRWMQSQKLAGRAISRFKSFPGGGIKHCCDILAESVRELTGYDSVMVYKFHEEEHSEVVAESKRPDLEPCIGLHHLAFDIPQDLKLMFKQNRISMIVDRHETPVHVIQDEGLMQPLCLIGSTLLAPHNCHAKYMANMRSTASLAIAIVINGHDEEIVTNFTSIMRPWGLVVYHHTSALFIPFPLRCTCEFLIQAFEHQLNVELQLESVLLEKQVLRTQAVLYGMLLRDSAAGIVTQSPSIMDLMKCDGAALYYHGNYYPLGVTPNESQVKDIIGWLLTFHGDSTSADSLADAGYPGAASLGDSVCGMTVAYITAEDFLFWFRSRVAREIKPDGSKDLELNEIRSVQLILQESMNVVEHSNSKSVVDSQPRHHELTGVDVLIWTAKEIDRLIETAIAPIFSVDVDGRIRGWNAKVAELTRLLVEEAVGKSLAHDLVHKESKESVDRLISRALRGEEDKNVEIKMRTFGPQKYKMAVFVAVNACSTKDPINEITGVCFIGQDVADQKVLMDKFIHLQGDYKAIVHNPSPLVPPIFASDANTCCSEWNIAMEKLTGWVRGDVIGKLLVGEVFGNFCQLKGLNAVANFSILLHNAHGGQDTEKFPLSFLDRHGNFVQALLTAHKRVNPNGQIIGVLCFLQTASPELQQSLDVQRQMEKNCLAVMKELAFIRQEIKNPLSGIRFSNSLLKDTELTDDQNQFLVAIDACEKQMFKIIHDAGLESIEDSWSILVGAFLSSDNIQHLRFFKWSILNVPTQTKHMSLELEKEEFLLGNAIDAVISQVTLSLRERYLQLICNISKKVKRLAVYGDQSRMQQVLADFLLNMVHYAPSPDGWVEIDVDARFKKISDGLTLLHATFRMVCPGEGLPPELIQDMFHSSEWRSQEGLGLGMSRKILGLMDGEESECHVLEEALDLLQEVLGAGRGFGGAAGGAAGGVEEVLAEQLVVLDQNSYNIVRLWCEGYGLFHGSEWRSREGLGLSIGRKIRKPMDGEVQIYEGGRKVLLLDWA
ncbi:phytochrome B-like [Neltuma alba]|uniref:phytochrome B-like n=1 Tax=Neltuma alba TaxID=207710 RepID=UPI0010A51902|nr:phytochrome B-like [Prosopis alba]